MAPDVCLKYEGALGQSRYRVGSLDSTGGTMKETIDYVLEVGAVYCPQCRRVLSQVWEPEREEVLNATCLRCQRSWELTVPHRFATEVPFA